MKSQNIARVGARANGAGIGGAGLARADLDVTFIEPAHAEAMRRTGRHASRDFGHTCLWPSTRGGSAAPVPARP
jgi:hypothetical protein